MFLFCWTIPVNSKMPETTKCFLVLQTVLLCLQYQVNQYNSRAPLFELMTIRWAGSWAGPFVKKQNVIGWEQRYTWERTYCPSLASNLAPSHNGERIHTERLLRPTRSWPKNYTSAPWELFQAYVLVSHFLRSAFLLFQSSLRAVSVFVFVWALQRQHGKLHL